MEISSTLLEQALGGVNELALPVAGASCLYALVRSPAPTPAAASRPRRRRARLVRRGVSFLGLLLSVPSPAPAATRRPPSAPAATEVRTEPGGFPPPRLLGSAGPLAPSPAPSGDGPPRTPIRREPPWTAEKTAGRSHPAVHGGSLGKTGSPLFERWEGASCSARPEATTVEQWHAVLPGDTLWSIAARRLHTDDVRRIARYWPRIHRANRDEVGPDPNLIRPGQVLELPPEDA